MMTSDQTRLDGIVAGALRTPGQRSNGCRERALTMYPRTCGRCARQFTRADLRELTVHHRNHNREDNFVNSSSWELLCVYCHDNEHSPAA